MASDDLDMARAWLKREQGIDLENGSILDPWEGSARMGDVTRRITESLPLEPEPSAFAAALEALAPKGTRR